MQLSKMQTVNPRNDRPQVQVPQKSPAQPPAQPPIQPLVWFGFFLLSVVTAIYGFTYLVVDGVVDRLPIAVLNLGQFGIATLLFSPWLTRKGLVWRAGLELSVIIAGYYSLQALALLQTNVHQSAFILTLDTLFVPFLMCLGCDRPSRGLWLASGLAFSGVVIMTHAPGVHHLGLPHLKDCWALFAAFVYAIYLLRIDYWTDRLPSLPLTAAQSCCGAGLSLVWVIVAQPQWLTPTYLQQIHWADLIYLGAMATGLTTFLQLWGQRHINATQAAIALALEPVWASGFAYVLRQEHPGDRGLWGAGVILIATAISMLSRAKSSGLGLDLLETATVNSADLQGETSPTVTLAKAPSVTEISRASH